MLGPHALAASCLLRPCFSREFFLLLNIIIIIIMMMMMMMMMMMIISIALTSINCPRRFTKLKLKIKNKKTRIARIKN